MAGITQTVRQIVIGAVQSGIRATLGPCLNDVLPGIVRRALLPPLLARAQSNETTGRSLSGIDATLRFETAQVERFFRAARVPPVPNARPPP